MKELLIIGGHDFVSGIKTENQCFYMIQGEVL